MSMLELVISLLCIGVILTVRENCKRKKRFREKIKKMNDNKIVIDDGNRALNNRHRNIR